MMALPMHIPTSYRAAVAPGNDGLRAWFHFAIVKTQRAIIQLSTNTGAGTVMGRRARAASDSLNP